MYLLKILYYIIKLYDMQTRKDTAHASSNRICPNSDLRVQNPFLGSNFFSFV